MQSAIGVAIQHGLDFLVAISGWPPRLAGDLGGHLGMPSVIRVAIQHGLDFMVAR